MYCQHCMKNQERKGRFCVYCGKDLTAQNAPHQLPVGTRLQDRYVVGAAIGQGGFGITYVGMDMRIHKKIAIKEYFPKGLVDRRGGDTNISVTAGTEKVYFEKEKQRFLQEAEILAKFSGERNIVGISDNFEEHNTVYIVMDFIEGRRLDEYLTQQGTLTFEKLFTLFSPLMQSLSRVHSTGLIHRDISPQNIMVLPDETLILLDFGAAREYGESKETSLSVILKHGYSPSEQYMSHGRQGPWTDVYALCATMYRMLTTVMPPTAIERMASDTLKKPSELGASISPAEEEVLLHGLALDIENRIQSMEELHSEFRSAMEKGRAYRYRGKNPQKKKKSGAPLFLVPAALIAAAAVAFSGIGRKNAAVSSVPGTGQAGESGDTADADRKGNENAAEDAAGKSLNRVPEGFTVEEMVIPVTGSSSYYYDSFIIGNASGKTVKAKLTCTSYDASGTVLETKNSYVDPLGDGEQGIVHFMLDNKEGKIDHVSFTLDPEETTKESADAFFDVMEQDTGRGMLFTGKNIGERTLGNQEFHVLFLDAEGKAVEHVTSSISGVNYRLRPGEEWSCLAVCSKEYASIKYAVTGEVEDEEPENAAIPAEQTEQELLGPPLDGVFHVLITNRSEQTGSFRVNVVAEDESGVPRNAGSGDVEVIEPGEQILVPVRVSYSKDIPDSHVTIRVSGEENPDRRSAVPDLVCESRKENKSLLTAVTNYGRGDAKRVHMFVVFRDAENNILHVRDYSDFPELGTLALGTTATQQIDCPKEFDHADIYFSGYKEGADPGNGVQLKPEDDSSSKLAEAVYEKPLLETVLESMDYCWGSTNKGDEAENYVFFINKALNYGGYYRFSSGKMSGMVGDVRAGTEKAYKDDKTSATLYEYIIKADNDQEASVFVTVDGGRPGAETPPGGPTLLQIPGMEDHAEAVSDNEASRKAAESLSNFFFGSF